MQADAAKPQQRTDEVRNAKVDERMDDFVRPSVFYGLTVVDVGGRILSTSPHTFYHSTLCGKREPLGCCKCTNILENMIKHSVMWLVQFLDRPRTPHFAVFKCCYALVEPGSSTILGLEPYVQEEKVISQGRCCPGRLVGRIYHTNRVKIVPHTRQAAWLAFHFGCNNYIPYW
jgi:hypothetical protein